MANIVKSYIVKLKTIGLILRELRESKGLLLREVGAKLSLDPAILSKIERDERFPTKEQMNLLANFYHERKNCIIISWLTDKLFKDLKDEEHSLEVVGSLTKKIKYLNRNKKL